MLTFRFHRRQNVMSITGYCRMNDQYLITAYDKLFQLNFDVNREDHKFQVKKLFDER